MNNFKGYISTLIRTFNPLSYRDLSESTKKRSLGFFFTSILIACIIMSVLYIPKFFNVENNVEIIFSKLDIFNANVEIKTLEPIFIPENIKNNEQFFFILDTEAQYSENSSQIYVDKNFIYYNYGKNRKTLDEFFNIKQNQESIKQFIKIALIVLAPTLFILAYLGHILGFGLVILILAGFTAIVSSKFDHKIKFYEALNIGLFSSIFLAISMIIRPIYPNGKIYLIAIFLIYFILGIIFSMRTESKRTSKKEKGEEK